MKIELQRIPIRQVIADYVDNAEEGVIAYSGRLDVRPPYQREFVYKDKMREAVLETIKSGFPLGVFYWVKTSPNTWEMVDGQQRTISLCQYVNGDFPIKDRFFDNLTNAEKNVILDYELMVYFCEGTDKERLDWFRIINIAGMKLTEQELRNAVYAGPWLSDAKLKFSKTGCAAYLLANDGGKLVGGEPIRQDYLETVLKWISNGDIDVYMAEHQHDVNANKLWGYFQKVMEWTRSTFTTYRNEMSKVEWGELYNTLKDDVLKPKKLEAEVSALMLDEDVTKKSGIYEYVLTHNERALSIRAFTDNQKRESYERQKGVCPKCGKKFKIDEMEADHITPWHGGGKTISDNCQMLCKADNRTKSGV
jgi:5-methylcytosine-specific restriction endonuclease McrA